MKHVGILLSGLLALAALAGVLADGANDSVRAESGLDVAGNSAAAAQPGMVAPEVNEALKSASSMSVIVSLASKPVLPPGGPVDLPALVESIAASAERVLAAVPRAEFELTHRYTAVPAVAGDATAAGIAALAAQPDVVHVALNREVHAALSEAVPLIRADDVHSVLGITGEGVHVAVLDTGIDTDHPMLSDDLVHEDCFLDDGVCPFGGASCTGPGCAEDDEGHGSHVSGIITSAGSPVGIAPDALIEAIKVLNFAGSGFFSDLVLAYDHIILSHAEVDIINMSLGDGGSYPSGACEGFIPAFTSAIATTRAMGMTTFAAAGNNASKVGIGYPACIIDIESVGAVYDADVGPRIWSACPDPVTFADLPVCFSQSDVSLDLLAPGSIITSTVPGGGLANKSGTSMASPAAAAVAALLLDSEPLLTPADVGTQLQETGVEVTDPANGVTTCRVDAFETVINDGGPICEGTQPPPNDDFADAFEIPEPLPYSNSQSAVGATAEPGEPLLTFDCGPSPDDMDRTVWYRYTPTTSVTVSANTFGSNYDTRLAVQTGGSMDVLSLIDCDDDTGGLQSEVVFPASAGTTYHFQIDGFNAAGGNLVFNLDEHPGPEPPPNDDFADAIVIPEPLPYTDLQSTVAATTEPGEPSACALIGSTVWYRFTPTSNGTLVADTLGSHYDTALAVYTGASLDTLVPVGCDDNSGPVLLSELTFPVSAGTSYQIQVGGSAGDSGDLVFNLQEEGAQLEIPWSMFQHDLQHTGRSPFVGPQMNEVRCDLTVGGSGLGSPAIARDGTIYIPSGILGDGGGFLNAVKPGCTTKWVFKFPAPPASTAPALASDGTIYVHTNGPASASCRERLYAINPNGTEKWQFEVGSGACKLKGSVMSSPAVAPDGTVYFGSKGSTFLYALNPDDGSINWAVSPSLSSISSSPAIAPDGTIYITTSNDLFAVAPDGTILCSFPVLGHFASPSVGADGTIYIPHLWRLQAVNPDCTLKWDLPLESGTSISSTPAIAADGTIYVVPVRTGLFSIDPTGSINWHFQPFGVSGVGPSPVIGADGIIYFRANGFSGVRGLYALNPDGTEKWHMTTPRANFLAPSGAIGADGILYIGIDDENGPLNVLRAIGPTPVPDSDSDGFTDDVEQFVGTDPLLACGPSAWPPDFNDDTRVNLADVFLFRSHFATIDGDPDYDKRFDLNADGRINLADVFILRQYFATQCVP